jgi:hypothetical protein
MGWVQVPKEGGAKGFRHARAALIPALERAGFVQELAPIRGE